MRTLVIMVMRGSHQRKTAANVIVDTNSVRRCGERDRRQPTQLPTGTGVAVSRSVSGSGASDVPDRPQRLRMKTGTSGDPWRLQDLLNAWTRIPRKRSVSKSPLARARQY